MFHEFYIMSYGGINIWYYVLRVFISPLYIIISFPSDRDVLTAFPSVLNCNV